MANNAKKGTVQNTVDELEGVLDVEEEIKRRSKVTVKLSHPVNWEGKTYEELTMDYESMTGRDMEAVDDELAAMRAVVTSPHFSNRYQRLLAARAASVPSDMIAKLPLLDYRKVVNTARSFLFLTL